MAVSKKDIQDWLNCEKGNNKSHMIVVCDTFDWDDYPVYVENGHDIQKYIKEYNGVNMQKIMEIYNYSLDLEVQLNEHRAYHL